MAAGMDGYLSKPVRQSQLQGEMERVLRRSLASPRHTGPEPFSAKVRPGLAGATGAASSSLVPALLGGGAGARLPDPVRPAPSVRLETPVFRSSDPVPTLPRASKLVPPVASSIVTQATGSDPATYAELDVDWPQLRQRLGGDEAALVELMEAFLEDRTQRLRLIEQGIQAQDGPTAMRSIYTLLGAASSLCLPAVELFAQKLYRSAQQAEWEACQVGMAALAERMQRVEGAFAARPAVEEEG
jgi:HPt (histidine-containing phosphotransfer) domain-containing protein